MKPGFSTHSKDITGKTICLGDILTYDFPEDTPAYYEVVFKENAMRMKPINYDWPENLSYPMLHIGGMIEKMKVKIVRKYNEKAQK